MIFRLFQAKESAERTLGFTIDRETAQKVLNYSKRKCRMSKMPKSYLPLLYENELTDHFMGLAINLKGEMNRVQRMLPKPMQSTLSECTDPSNNLYLQTLQGTGD